MKLRYLVLVLLALLAGRVSGRAQGQGKQAFTLFNEGVAQSLAAADAYEKKDYEQSKALTRTAIARFRATLAADSAHEGARSALGHSHYLLNEFSQAVHWFEQAHKTSGADAATFRELGLSRINLGQLKEGYHDLELAFQLDPSREVRRLTVDDLSDIGQLAFEYGESYVQQGEAEKGKTYQLFSLDVLRVAFIIDSTRKDIARAIVAAAEKMGDKALADKYRAK